MDGFSECWFVVRILGKLVNGRFMERFTIIGYDGNNGDIWDVILKRIGIRKMKNKWTLALL